MPLDLSARPPGDPTPSAQDAPPPSGDALPGSQREARLRVWLLGRAPSSAVWGWLGPLLVTALGGLLRFWRLDQPHQLVFDETYYVKQAYSLWQTGVEYQWPEKSDERFTKGDYDIYLTAADRTVHPPVGKWMIAAGEWLTGIDSSWGWRLSAAVVGTLMILILARTARRLFNSTLLGCTAGLLLAVDGHHLVLSRTGILDVFLAFWVLCAFSLLVLDRDHSRRRLARWAARRERPGWLGPWTGVTWLRLAAAVCLGLAAGVKWSAIYFAAAFCLMTVLWTVGARRAVGVRDPWAGSVFKDGVPAALTMLPVMVGTYLATWTAWMRSDDAYFRQWGAQHPSDSIFPDVLRSLWHYHADMYAFHTSLGSHHPYSSKPWAWLFNTRPTSFFYEGPESGEDGCTVELCSKAITSIGNPVVWWLGAAALILLVAVWAGRRDWRAGAILGAFLAGWAPWLLYPERTIFFFYAVAFVPYTVLALTYLLGMILGPPDARGDRRVWGAALAGAVVVLAVLAMAFFWPVTTAEVIPHRAWQLRMWLPSWV